jgi:hypothetical protein
VLIKNEIFRACEVRAKYCCVGVAYAVVLYADFPSVSRVILRMKKLSGTVEKAGYLR